MHLAFQLLHLLFVEDLLEIVLVKGRLSRSLSYRRELGRKGEKSAAYGVITAHLKFLVSKTIELQKILL